MKIKCADYNKKIGKCFSQSFIPVSEDSICLGFESKRRGVITKCKNCKKWITNDKSTYST